MIVFLRGDIMALIKCPECGRDISSFSNQCIHCGFPLEQIGQDGICVIDGTAHNLTEFKDRLLSADRNDKEETNKIIRDLYHVIGTISIYAAAELAKIILNTGKIPVEYDGSRLTVHATKDDGLLHCPKCNSTNVTTGSRGYSIMWGFIGSGKTVNRCGSCGHKWEPKR